MSRPLNNDQLPRWICFLILFLLAFLAYFQVITLNHPLKFDLIDQAFPWKYFIGESLQNGMLPLWNPYQLLGSPIHADPQSSAWYPLVWVFGWLFGYDIYTVSIDFFLHIILAGFGMFYLGKQLKFRNETALLMGAAYMLSGFFTGNAQHFMWIISGTWLPFIIGAFLEIRNSFSWQPVIKFSLASFMILSGGYPAFILILAYMLFFLFLFFIFFMMKEKKYREVFKYSLLNIVVLILTILTGMVILISVYHLRNEMTRGNGVSLIQALFGPFSPQSFISFILPFAVVRDMDFYQTDMSMANAYFGILPFILFLSGIFIRKPGLIKFFFWWGILMLLAAVGKYMPVREFLYHYVPFMNFFRFPALFRVFVIICFVIVAGYSFEHWREHPEKTGRIILRVSAVISVLIAGFVIFALSWKELHFFDFLRNDLFIFSEKSTIPQHLLFQGTIQLLLLAIFIYGMIKLKAWKSKLILFFSILSVDLVLANGLNAPYTVYYDQVRSKDIKVHSATFPEGFPIPGNQPLIDNTDQGKLVYKALWRNLNIFHKQISFQGYNPLHLNGFEELADNHTAFFETILKNPLVYLSANIFPLDSMKSFETKMNYDSSYIFLGKDVYREINPEGFSHHSTDSLKIIAFRPDRIAIKCFSQSPQMLVFMQNKYYGWKAYIDGKKTELFSSNLAFLSIILPAGQHEVIFDYHPQGVITGFWISAIMILILLLSWSGIFIYRKWKQQRQTRAPGEI